ncbi:hypothetical protein BgiBS90_003206 [Biomphalaria glabrata]|nr:hypothetical protein BgiBS90_003206 [Biomphalaria glabrata]
MRSGTSPTSDLTIQVPQKEPFNHGKSSDVVRHMDDVAEYGYMKVKTMDSRSRISEVVLELNSSQHPSQDSYNTYPETDMMRSLNLGSRSNEISSTLPEPQSTLTECSRDSVQCPTWSIVYLAADRRPIESILECAAQPTSDFQTSQESTQG